MKIKLKYKINIVDVVMWALIISGICVLLFVPGCTNHTTKSLVVVNIHNPEEGKVSKVMYRDEDSHYSLLSLTEVKDSEHTTPLSTTYIGELKTVPDPNSIKATGSLLGEFVQSLIK